MCDTQRKRDLLEFLVFSFWYRLDNRTNYRKTHLTFGQNGNFRQCLISLLQV